VGGIHTRTWRESPSIHSRRSHMAHPRARIHTDAYESVRAGGIYCERDIHVNHLIHWPRPHGEQKIDLVDGSVIAGVVENHQENQGD
jgi:hypothetical protein